MNILSITQMSLTDHWMSNKMNGFEAKGTVCDSSFSNFIWFDYILSDSCEIM